MKRSESSNCRFVRDDFIALHSFDATDAPRVHSFFLFSNITSRVAGVFFEEERRRRVLVAYLDANFSHLIAVPEISGSCISGPLTSLIGYPD